MFKKTLKRDIASREEHHYKNNTGTEKAIKENYDEITVPEKLGKNYAGKESQETSDRCIYID